MTHQVAIDCPTYLQELQRGAWRNDGSLPPNWEELIDQETGKQYYVDHNTESTSWVDPRDIFIKPLSFNDCEGQEFSFGWESSRDAVVGEYYIDHNSWTTTLSDPRFNNTLSNIMAAGFRGANMEDDTVMAVQEQLLVAEQHLHNLNEDLRQAPPMSVDSINLQRQLAAQLTKVADLQDQLDLAMVKSNAALQGMSAMTSVFGGREQNKLSKDMIDLHHEENEELAEASRKIHQLITAHEDHTAQMSDRINSLQRENELVKTQMAKNNEMEKEMQLRILAERNMNDDVVTKAHLREHLADMETVRQAEQQEMWAELEATTEVFMSKPKLQAIIKNQQSQIDELRRSMPQKEEFKGKRVWNNDIQAFENVTTEEEHKNLQRKFDELHSEVSALKQTVKSGSVGSSDVKGDLLASARKMSSEITSATEAASAPTKDRRLSTKERLLQSATNLHGELDVAVSALSITRESDVITPPNAPGIAPGAHSTPYYTPFGQSTPLRPRSPTEWKEADVKSWFVSKGYSVLAEHLFQDGITGNDLLDLQPHDLSAFGVKDTREQDHIMLNITQLFVEDPVVTQLPMEQWQVLHVRHWLISIGLSSRCAVFQRALVNGRTLSDFTKQDLKDLNMSNPTEMNTILDFIEKNKQTVSPRSSGSNGQITRRAGKRPSDLYVNRPQSMVVTTNPEDYPGDISKWTEQHVQKWLVETHRSRYADKMRSYNIDGRALLELQSYDLEDLGCSDAFEARQFLIGITELTTADPVKAGIPIRNWTFWQVRLWLLRNDRVDAVPVFQKTNLNGERLVMLTQQDLQDLGFEDNTRTKSLLALISRACGEPSSPARGGIDWQEHSQRTRRNSRSSLKSKRKDTK